MLRREINRVLEELPSRGPFALELGCGHGHFLAEFARLHPNTRCLGVDYCLDRVRRAERKRVRGEFTNLRFLRAEVRDFVLAIPGEITFEQIFVLFPDPWPKRRHRKNRFVCADLIADLDNATSPGTRFFFRSDNPDYVSEVRDLFSRRPGWRTLAENQLPVETVSVFQEKAGAFGTMVAEKIS